VFNLLLTCRKIQIVSNLGGITVLLRHDRLLSAQFYCAMTVCCLHSSQVNDRVDFVNRLHSAAQQTVRPKANILHLEILRRTEGGGRPAALASLSTLAAFHVPTIYCIDTPSPRLGCAVLLETYDSYLGSRRVLKLLHSLGTANLFDTKYVP
jgi:hypothetical protein